MSGKGKLREGLFKIYLKVVKSLLDVLVQLLTSVRPLFILVVGSFLGIIKSTSQIKKNN